jgi:hypothetical protein
MYLDVRYVERGIIPGKYSSNLNYSINRQWKIPVSNLIWIHYASVSET